ncbi:MAG TPA: hypothetical protein VK824_09190 [Planctomycetota bacterium]|nr:hypothetical protein [Planctomycetota bacterium]
MNARERRRLSLAWLGALAALALLAGGGCWLAIRAVREADDSRLLLAVARQRMLGQRVGLLAHQYVATDDDYVRLDLRWELRASAAELRHTLNRHVMPGRAAGADPLEPPLTTRPLSDAVSAIYDDTPHRLAPRVRELAASVDRLCSDAAAGDVKDPLEEAGEVEDASIAALPAMDALTEQLELEHEAAVETLVALQYKLLGAMLVALLAAGVMLTRSGRGPRAQAARRAEHAVAPVPRPAGQPVASTPAPPVGASGHSAG